MRLILLLALFYSHLCFAGTDGFSIFEKVKIKEMKETKLISITIHFDKDELEDEIINMLKDNEDYSLIKEKVEILKFLHPTCEMWELNIKDRNQNLDFLDIECKNKFKKHKREECNQGGCYPVFDYEATNIKGIVRFLDSK